MIRHFAVLGASVLAFVSKCWNNWHNKNVTCTTTYYCPIFFTLVNYFVIF